MGNWTVADYCKPETLGKFDPSRKNWSGKMAIKKLSFYPDGSCIRCQTNRDVTLKWTKGYLIDTLQELSMSYEIRTINDVDYLIVEWKSGDYVFSGKAPGYYIFVRS